MANNRVYVPVSPETREAMQALADVRRSTITAICAEMLETVTPVARDMAKALQTAQAAPARALRIMNDRLVQELAELEKTQSQLDMLDVSPRATGRKKNTG